MTVSAGRPATLADRLRHWWIETLEADSVRKWIPPYCTIWLSWAVLAVVVFPPVPTIYDSMGSFAYWIWVGVAIPANLAPMVGLRLRHGGSPIQDMSTRLLFLDWTGLMLQAIGLGVCHILMVWFEIAAWVGVANYEGPNTYPGLTIFCAFMLLAWTGGTAVLCAQCIRKVKRGIDIERREMQRRQEGQS